MGCTISVQPNLGNSPRGVLSKSQTAASISQQTEFQDNPTAHTNNYTEPPIQSNPSISPAKITEPTKPSSIPLNSPKQETITPVIPSGLVVEEEAVTMQDLPARQPLLGIDRRLSNDSANKTPRHTMKPSTFFKEKVYTEENLQILSGADHQMTEQDFFVDRRTSLGLSLTQKFQSGPRDQDDSSLKTMGRKSKTSFLKNPTNPTVETLDPTMMNLLDLKSHRALSPLASSPFSSEDYLKDFSTAVSAVSRIQMTMNKRQKCLTIPIPPLKGGKIVRNVVVNEETEAEEKGEHDMKQEQEKFLEKERLKKHIEKNFTANLLNVVLGKNIPTESTKVPSRTDTQATHLTQLDFLSPKLQKPDQQIQKGLKLALVDYEEDDSGNTVDHYEEKKEALEQQARKKSLLSPINKKNFQKQYTLPLPLPQFGLGLDLSIERSMLQGEEEIDSTWRPTTPVTPIRKSIFGSGTEESSDPGSKAIQSLLGVRRRISHFGLTVKGVGPNGEQMTSPSILMSERKNLMSETAGSSVIETKVLDKSIDEGGQKKVNQYAIGKELGRGSFGRVKMGIDTKTGMNYAIKTANKQKLKKKLLARDKSVYSQLEGEIAVMKKLNHQNIVKLYEVIDDPNAEKLYLVMEYVHRGAVMSKQYWDSDNARLPLTKSNSETNANLKKILRRGFSTTAEMDAQLMAFHRSENMNHEGRVLSEDKARKYFRDLILGLDYLHNYAKVIHRDIKPENLLIDHNDTLKISDFNISMIMENIADKNLLKNAAGTKTFLAPEAWVGGQFRGEPVDIWAAGATLYYMLYGKPPFQATNQIQMKQKILNEEPVFPDEITVSDDAIDLIKSCLSKNPEERAKLEEIMCSKWLTENGSVVLDNRNAGMLVINEEDLKQAMTNKLQATFLIALGLSRSARTARLSLEAKKAHDTSQISQLNNSHTVIDPILEDEQP